MHGEDLQAGVHVAWGCGGDLDGGQEEGVDWAVGFHEGPY